MPDGDCNDAVAGRKPGSDWTPHDFEELVRCCGENISKFCCRQLGKFDGQDAIQHTLMNAWNGRASFDPVKLGPGGLKGWLGSIARRVCSHMLKKRHPSLIKMGNKGHANAIVDNHFSLPLFVSPSVAVFSAKNLPLWLKLDRKPKDEPAARQFLRGLPPAIGRFEIMLIAEHDSTRATQRLILTVLAKSPLAEAGNRESDNTERAADEETPRARHETIQDDANLVSDFSPAFGSKEDVEWYLTCLCEREKEVIIRTFWDEQTDEEIEGAMGLNKGHVKRIRWRAMQKLRRYDDEDSSPRCQGGPIQ